MRAGRRPEVTLSRRPDGYQLAVDPMTIDLHRFRSLVARARAAGRDRDTALFGEALWLWRGDAFATLDTRGSTAFGTASTPSGWPPS